MYHTTGTPWIWQMAKKASRVIVSATMNASRLVGIKSQVTFLSTSTMMLTSTVATATTISRVLIYASRFCISILLVLQGKVVGDPALGVLLF